MANSRQANRVARPLSSAPASEARCLAVAHLLDELRFGGAERTAVNLVNGLARRGHRCHLICSRSSGPLAAELEGGVRVWEAGRRSRWDLKGMRRIANYIDEHGIELVHSHNHNSSFLTRFVIRFVRRPLQHVVHDHDGLAVGNVKTALKDWLMLRHVDAYLSVTEDLHRRACRLLPLPRDRCVFVPNGVVVPPDPPSWEGSPTVVQVANLMEPKGHQTAMRAAAALRRRFPDLRWICVGRIPDPPTRYLEEVRGLVGSLSLDNCVTFTGERADIRPFLEGAHVGVLTSDAEAMPLVLLEYMAHRLPVVATAVGQVPAIVELAGCGQLVPAGEPDAVARAVQRLLDDPKGALEMGSAGRECVRKHYSGDAMIQRVEGIYRQVLSAQLPLMVTGESGARPTRSCPRS